MTRYVQDLETGQLIEVPTRREARRSHYVRGDIEPFRSSVDGSVISSARDLREHNKRTGMTNDLDSLREQSHRAGNKEKGVDNSREAKHERKLAIKDSMERAASSGFHRHIQYQD